MWKPCSRSKDLRRRSTHPWRDGSEAEWCCCQAGFLPGSVSTVQAYRMRIGLGTGFRDEVDFVKSCEGHRPTHLRSGGSTLNHATMMVNSVRDLLQRGPRMSFPLWLMLTACDPSP